MDVPGRCESPWHYVHNDFLTASLTFKNYFPYVTLQLALFESYNLIKSGIHSLSTNYFEAAITFFDSSLLINSNNPVAYFYKGLAHKNLGNYDETKTNMLAAINFNDYNTYFEQEYINLNNVIPLEKTNDDISNLHDDTISQIIEQLDSQGDINPNDIIPPQETSDDISNFHDDSWFRK